MEQFTAPKNISPHFYCKRLPRKFKKKHKVLLNKYSFLTLNQKLWLILGETNKKYRDFLIKNIYYENI